MKNQYRYVYECRTDNLCWGSIRIGIYATRDEAQSAGVNAGKGCFTVRKIRVPIVS